MKSLLWNLFWLTVFTSSFYYAIVRLENANKKCLDGVARIESTLNTWEIQSN